MNCGDSKINLVRFIRKKTWITNALSCTFLWKNGIRFELFFVKQCSQKFLILECFWHQSPPSTLLFPLNTNISIKFQLNHNVSVSHNYFKPLFGSNWDTCSTFFRFNHSKRFFNCLQINFQKHIHFFIVTAQLITRYS